MRHWIVAAVAAFAMAGAAAATAAQAAPMAFRLSASSDCPRQGCVVAVGDIVPETAADFGRFLRTAKVEPGALMVFNSRGGDLTASLKLGALIRRAGLDTRVQAIDIRNEAWFPGARCASACAYAFLGGRIRTVPPDAAYGVHQFQAGDAGGVISVAQSQRVAASILDYLDALQISPRLASEALKTDGGRIRWLMQDELRTLGVVAGETRASLF
jgi:hypothetical protein